VCAAGSEDARVSRWPENSAALALRSLGGGRGAEVDEAAGAVLVVACVPEGAVLLVA
jgi:hypothetical protein